MTDLLPGHLTTPLPPLLRRAADLLQSGQPAQAREQAGIILGNTAPDDNADLFQALTIKVQASRVMGDSQSIRYGLELVNLAERIDSNAYRTAAHYELGESYRQIGELERAITHLRESLRYVSLEDASQVGLPFLRLGQTYLVLSRISDALACLERARNCFLHMGEAGHAGEALLGESRALIALKQFAEAQHRLERAEAGFRLAEAFDQLPVTYRLMARAALGREAIAEAAGNYRLAMKLHEQGHGTDTEADTRLELAGFQLRSGDPRSAEENLDVAVELYRAADNQEGTARAIRLLGHVFERSGDTDAAVASLKEHLQLRASIHQKTVSTQEHIRIMQLEESLEREHNAARRAHQALIEANRQLRLQSAKLENLSNTDHLTGLYNRRFLADLLRRWAESDGQMPCLILIDVDGFKQINDTYGHDRGDEVLKQLAAILQTTVQGKGVLARWGGEEFAVGVHGTHCADTTVLAEAVRKAVQDATWDAIDPGLRITVSLGVTCSSRDVDLDFPGLLRLADERLYSAKRQGRNSVIFSN